MKCSPQAHSTAKKTLQIFFNIDYPIQFHLFKVLIKETICI